MLKKLKKIIESSHRTREKEPFEELFTEITDVYNEYLACVDLTKFHSVSSIWEYKCLREFLESRGLRTESINRIYQGIETEINKIADDDAKILNTVKREDTTNND